MLQFKHWQPPFPKKGSRMGQKKSWMGGRCKSVVVSVRHDWIQEIFKNLLCMHQFMAYLNKINVASEFVKS